MKIRSRVHTIKSHIPGRLRLRVPTIRFSQERADSLKAQLSNQPIVLSAEVRPMTGSVILLFHAGTVRADVVLDLVTKALDEALLPLSSGDISGTLRITPSNGHAACGLDCRVCHPIPRTLQRRSLAGRLVEVVAITAFVGYILIRRKMEGLFGDKAPGSLKGQGISGKPPYRPRHKPGAHRHRAGQAHCPRASGSPRHRNHGWPPHSSRP